MERSKPPADIDYLAVWIPFSAYWRCPLPMHNVIQIASNLYSHQASQL